MRRVYLNKDDEFFENRNNKIAWFLSPSDLGGSYSTASNGIRVQETGMLPICMLVSTVLILH